MRQKVILIDANSFLYRSYYAASPLDKYRYARSSAAIYGFSKMLLRLVNKEKPDYVAVAFDLPAPTQRKKRFIEYKAKRPKMPPDLKAQVPYIKEIIAGLGVPCFEMDGFDADDILATLAKKLFESEADILIVTSFKDALSLTENPNIKILNPHQKNLVYDAKLVKEKFGVGPEKFADFLALVGDDAQNIPGVPGIGAKTAAALLGKYKSVEGIIANLDKIKPELAKAIKENKDAVLIGAKIATIDALLPIQAQIENLRKGKYDFEKLSAIFKRFGFTDLLIPISSHSHETPADYKCVVDEVVFNQMLGKLKNCREFCFDTETTSIDPLTARIVGMSFSFQNNQAYYIPLGHDYQGAPKQLDKEMVFGKLRQYFQDEAKLKIGQNVKYDLEILSGCGIDVKGKFFDTMVASYMLSPSMAGHDLDSLSLKYIGHRMITFDDLVGEKKSISDVEIKLASEYACEDADIALRVKNILGAQLKEKNLYEAFVDVEMKLLPVLKDMEIAGVGIDTEHLGRSLNRFDTALKRLEKQIKKIAGEDFNINSPAQLSGLLSGKLKLGKPGKKLSADRHTLAGLARKSPFVKKVLQARQAEELLSGFLKPFYSHVKDGRAHPVYSQIHSEVRKITSSRPNLLHIPREHFIGAEARRCFIAEKGRVFLSFDFSQLETRVLAHASGDEALINCFKEDSDPHKMFASYLYGKTAAKVNKKERDAAKVIFYGILHGHSPRKISLELGIEEKKAREFVAEISKRHPKLRRIAGANIQRMASDIVRLAMVRIKDILEREKLQSRIALQVDDEILLEATLDEAEQVKKLIKNELENLVKLEAPLAVEVKQGANWAFA